MFLTQSSCALVCNLVSVWICWLNINIYPGNINWWKNDNKAYFSEIDFRVGSIIRGWFFQLCSSNFIYSSIEIWNGGNGIFGEKSCRRHICIPIPSNYFHGKIQFTIYQIWKTHDSMSQWFWFIDYLIIPGSTYCLQCWGSPSNFSCIVDIRNKCNQKRKWKE